MPEAQPEPLSAERIAEIRRTVEQVEAHCTAGEWRYDGTDAVHVHADGRMAELVASVWGEEGSDDERSLGEFIACARRAVPDLLAEVERLREENLRLEGELDETQCALSDALNP